MLTKAVASESSAAVAHTAVGTGMHGGGGGRLRFAFAISCYDTARSQPPRKRGIAGAVLRTRYFRLRDVTSFHEGHPAACHWTLIETGSDWATPPPIFGQRIFGNIWKRFGCHDWEGGGVRRTCSVSKPGMLQNPITHRTALLCRRDCPAPNVPSVEAFSTTPSSKGHCAALLAQ